MRLRLLFSRDRDWLNNGISRAITVVALSSAAIGLTILLAMADGRGFSSNLAFIMPIAGLGWAVGRVRSPLLASFAIALLLTAASSAYLQGAALVRWIFPAGEGRLLVAVGPASAAIAGLALAAPASLLRWGLWPAAVLLGATTGLGLYASTTRGQIGWMACLAAVVFVLPWLPVSVVPPRWYHVFGRIFGAWVLSIGLLIGAASLVKRTAATSPTPPTLTLEPPQIDGMPMFEPPPSKFQRGHREEMPP